MVGDPGQLDPFSTIDEERWVGLPQNPVLNSVDALLAHHPTIPRRALRVSRRLDWRGTPAVREAFYPELHFGPAAEEGSRELRLGPGGSTLAGSVWNQASRAGWAYLELPDRPTLQVDDEAIDALVELVHDPQKEHYRFWCPFHAMTYDRSGDPLWGRPDVCALRLNPVTFGPDGHVFVDTDTVIDRERYEPGQAVLPPAI